jgi:hypothetical protein
MFSLKLPPTLIYEGGGETLIYEGGGGGNNRENMTRVFC